MPAADDEHERTVGLEREADQRPAAFDPRHDPIFQPGYDGAAAPFRADAQRGRRERLRPEPDPAPRPVDRETRAVRSTSGAPVPEQTAAPETAPEAPEFVGGVRVIDLDHPRDDTAADAAGEPAPRRRGPLARLVANPFVWVLLAFGLVLLIGGYQGYHGAIEATYGDAYYVSSDTGDADGNSSYIDSEVALALAPLSVLAGWAVIAATIVLCAVLWRRDRLDAEASVS